MVTELVHEQRTEEWFDVRKGRVTASNVGAILGLNPWRTKDDVMRSMVRETLGYESEFKGNIATEYGTRHEQDAIDEFTFISGTPVKECGFFAFEDWLGGSPDGLIYDYATVEVKCPFGMRNESDKNKFKSITEQKHYYAQVQICMFITKRLQCYFIQWSPQAGYVFELIEFDAHFLADALPKLKAFHDDYKQALLSPLKYINDKTAIKFDENKLVTEYMKTKEIMQTMKKRQDEIIKELRKLSNDKPAQFGEHKLIKTERNGSIAYKKVIEDHLQDVDVEPYRGKPSVSWSLR